MIQRSALPWRRPTKRICFPSGDQAGCAPSARRRFPLPSTFTRKSSETHQYLSLGLPGCGRYELSYTSVCPSGDHVGTAWICWPCTTLRSPLPSAFISQSSEFRLHFHSQRTRLTNAILRPSGDQLKPGQLTRARRRTPLPSALTTFTSNRPGLFPTKASFRPSGDHRAPHKLLRASLRLPLPSAFIT